MIEMMTRAQWGARAARSKTSLTSATALTIHYTGCDKGLSGEDNSDEVKLVRIIQNDHIGNRGWVDVAYNWLIGQTGTIYEGRGLGVRSAANGTNAGNNSSYAVCFLIGPSEAPSSRAVEALNDLRRYLGFDDVKVHSEWKATACPGDELRKRRDLGSFRGGNSYEPVSTDVVTASPEVRVRWLQAALGGLNIDGDFGPLSQDRFDANWLADKAKFSDQVDALIVNNPAVVRWVQAEINRREIDSLEIDGYFGPKSEAAVISFSPDGRIVTSATILDLLSR